MGKLLVLLLKKSETAKSQPGASPSPIPILIQHIW
jgi:hypothetical protein